MSLKKCKETRDKDLLLYSEIIHKMSLDRSILKISFFHLFYFISFYFIYLYRVQIVWIKLQMLAF